MVGAVPLLAVYNADPDDTPQMYFTHSLLDCGSHWKPWTKSKGRKQLDIFQRIKDTGAESTLLYTRTEADEA